MDYGVDARGQQVGVRVEVEAFVEKDRATYMFVELASYARLGQSKPNAPWQRPNASLADRVRVSLGDVSDELLGLIDRVPQRLNYSFVGF